MLQLDQASELLQGTKKKGVHPHKFDALDKGAAEKEFRDWVEKYM